LLLRQTPRLPIVEPARTLLVASSGGHLSQLHALAPRIPGLSTGARTWVTFDTPQSRSLLEGEDVVYVKYTAPRDWRNAALNLLPAWKLLKRGRFTHVVSTGSAIALTFLPLARARRIQVTYVESAARSHGPSLTGRILARVPGVELGTQYVDWADDRWSYVGSVLDGYASVRCGDEREIRTVLLTLGTIPYDFRRLVERMVAVLPCGARMVCQTGSTDVSGLPVDARAEMPGHELRAAIQVADVVVAHAGTGSALAALEAGKCAVLVPRELHHGEHVDDHQHQIADELARRGLAIHRSVETLTLDDLREAARFEVERVSAPPLRLINGRSPAHPLDPPDPLDSKPPLRDGPLPARPRTGRFERQRKPARASKRFERGPRHANGQLGATGVPEAHRAATQDNGATPTPLE
jgi:UDP-N-acetylglucosamine--N-acetylmuramyl-(pentapeptide) pyrophosphoryl-undecaprenol N-acetylglucosamine transferase